MALSGTEVFRRAVMILDEQSETGAAEWADTEEYRHRAVPILNMLINECSPYSDTYVPEQGARSTAGSIESLADYPDLDDYLCGTVLPYGLAAHLCMDDNPRVSAFAQQRYEALLARATRNLPSEWQPIENIYGGLEHNGYSRWA